jgi:alpha-1,2-mannosyltransferase
VVGMRAEVGVLLPVMLVLTRRWRTIAAAAATAAALIAAASLAFGPKVWTDYLHDALPTQTEVVTRTFEHFIVSMPTVFMNARVAGFPMPAAVAAQIMVAAMAVAAVVWTFWRRREPVLSKMLLVTAAFLVTPYAFNYDMVVFGWVALKLMERNDTEAWDYVLMLAVWATPFLTIPAGMAGLPISVLPMAALAGRLLWRTWAREQQGRGVTAGLTEPAVATPAAV